MLWTGKTIVKMGKILQGHKYAKRFKLGEKVLVREMTNLVLSRNILSIPRKMSSTTIKHIDNACHENKQSVWGPRSEMQQLLKCMTDNNYTYLTTDWFLIPNLSVMFSGPVQILLSCLPFFPLCSSWNLPTSPTNTDYHCLSWSVSLLLIWHTPLQLLLWRHKMKTMSFELYNTMMA
jgi:hypothetical protein